MGELQKFIESLLSKGRTSFPGEEARKCLHQSQSAFIQAAARLKKKGALLTPKRGFYLVVRPEDRPFGGPEPARWIDPLMKHLGIDYRISLLRAAAFHGSAHQAAMMFQVVAPQQISDIKLGRHRVQFLYQSKEHFQQVNRREWLDQLKTDAGYAQIAGIELTLLDSTRYFHKAAGIHGAAQIVHDLGSKAHGSKLAHAAQYYENSSVRRLGYLLEHFGYQRQAKSLLPFASQAKSFKPLDPAAKPVSTKLVPLEEKNQKWKLHINVPVEIDP